MTVSLESLRNRLAEIRDSSLGLFDRAEQIYVEVVEPEEPRRNWRNYPAVWSVLPAEMQLEADALRTELRRLIVRISGALKGTLLISDADLKDLGRHSKTMTAALRFNRFLHWGIQIHHDEGTVLGVDPAGQEERELTVPSEAKSAFC